MTEEPLWIPSAKKINISNLKKFMGYVNQKFSLNIDSYAELYDWSISADGNENFWTSFWDFAEVKSEKKGDIVKQGEGFFNVTWFPQARLNYAENILKKRDKDIALVFRGEDKVTRQMTWEELYLAVAKIQRFMQEAGLQTGDRVALLVPNIPEAVVCVLAAASLGLVSTLCSPDFGVEGVAERFAQIEPTLFIYADKCLYGGKVIDSEEKVTKILPLLPSVKCVVRISYFGMDPPVKPGDDNIRPGDDNIRLENDNIRLENDNIRLENDNIRLENDNTRSTTVIPRLDRGIHYSDYQHIINNVHSNTVAFLQLPFNHPLYILYSSGTTGIPKCIVHGAGGTLLQHKKEHLLHCDMKKGEKVFYYTTCGWMMWHWLISALSSECTLLLYDGSPSFPSPAILFQYMDNEGASFFGTSAKFIDSVKKSGFKPNEFFSLAQLNAIGSTGSPLTDDSFNFVYEHIKKDVCLSSLSGGTDIISCFVLGNPIGNVYRGEIQARGLGMAVQVFDEEGHSVFEKKGELVCTAPFPSAPLRFWNDPENKKYHASYFEKFPNIWCHGDFMELTRHGGAIIYGRSDATLNPGGVRIGTAEIYRQVEKFSEVLESIAVDQKWNGGADTRILLFVRLQPGFSLDEKLIQAIKETLRKNCSPRHVPAKIVEVADIPRTKSGKIVELAVRNVVNNERVKNIGALANPEALDYFKVEEYS